MTVAPVVIETTLCHSLDSSKPGMSLEVFVYSHNWTKDCLSYCSFILFAKPTLRVTFSSRIFFTSQLCWTLPWYILYTWHVRN